MSEFAGVIKIRHRCHCATAAEPPGDDGIIEHVFEIDGQEFPWYITEDGPEIVKLGEGLYAVSITLVCQAVDVIGIPIWVELTP